MQSNILVMGGPLPLLSLIARTLRSQQILCELLPPGACEQEALGRKPLGIIWAAEQGPFSGPLPLSPQLLASGVPILALGGMAEGLCLHFGGSVTERLPDPQTVTLGLSQQPLFTDIAGGERMLYGLQCLALPDCLACTATATERCIGFSHKEFPLYGMQYPIEHNDPDAVQLLRNFACLLCGAEPLWDEDRILQELKEHIRAMAGDGRVLCAVSGGVDSAVCAKIAHMALDDRLECVLIDTGFFRQGEVDSVLSLFREEMGVPITLLPAQERFLESLSGVTDFFEKERRVCALLKELLVDRLSQMSNARALLLGTHLNDTLFGNEPRASLPEAVAEPLLGLFKEEVRRLATALSLPAGLAERPSFPSGGLALRIFGEVTEARLAILRQAEAVLTEEVQQGGLERRLWRLNASLLELPYGADTYTVGLRALQAAQDGAYAARLPYDLLERVTQRTLAQIPSVTRVIYDLTPSMQYHRQE